MLDLFRDLEEKLLRPKTRNSPSDVATLLHSDFFEFGQSGIVWSRQQTIDMPGRERLMEGSLTDLSVRSLAADVTLVTYRAVGRDPASGNEWHSLRSSVWKLTDGRWQMIFHQGTPTQAPWPTKILTSAPSGLGREVSSALGIKRQIFTSSPVTQAPVAA